MLHGDHQVGFEVGANDPALPLTIDPVLEYSTYMGGSEEEWIDGIAVDSSGAAYVTGETYSSDFPLASPYQTDQGYWDAFVTKLAPGGNSVIYSTYLGGNDSDGASAIAVDSTGAVYVAGGTGSTNFPCLSLGSGTS